MATGGSFSYIEADTAQIYTGILGSRDFLIESPSPQLTRKLEKSLQHLTSMELHEVTLAEYYKSRIIPRGLRVHIVPTLFAQNEDFKKKFTQIINKCSFDLVTLTVEFLQMESTTTIKEIAALESQLSDLIGQEEFLKNRKTLDDKLFLFNKNTETCKRSKMDWERNDYINNRVYNWAEPIRFRAQFRKPRQNQPLSTSNSSMTSTGSSTNLSKGSFLQQGSSGPNTGGEEVRGTENATARSIATRTRNRQRT